MVSFLRSGRRRRRRPRIPATERWRESKSVRLELNRLAKMRIQKNTDGRPDFHYARPLSDLAIVPASELRLGRNARSFIGSSSGAKRSQKGRRKYSSRFDDILREYGVEVETRYIGAEEVNRRIDERLEAMNGEAKRRAGQEIEERADLYESMERILGRRPRPRDLFLNVGNW